MNYQSLQNLSAIFFIFLTFLLPETVYSDEIRRVSAKQEKQWYQENFLSIGPVQLIISIPDQKMSVYQNGEHIIETRISSGRPGHNTPAGVFSILGKRREHYSNLYDDAPMPFMQRLTWSGIALHAGNVSRRYASHGCVRMPYDFARKLFRYTRRGVHVIIAHEKVRPVEIMHENLISPTPRLIPVSEGSPSSAMGLTTQAFASTKNDGNGGRSEQYKRVPTEAEARLDSLKAEKAQNKKDLVTTIELIKQQKLALKESWNAYRQQNAKTAGLAYKHTRLLKQVNWAKGRLSHVKRTTVGKLAKAQKWLEITQKKQAWLKDKSEKLNAEIVLLKEAITSQENPRKARKKLSFLQRKYSRLLKQISWAEKKTATAKKYTDAQQVKTAVSIEKAEKQLLNLKNKLTAFNGEYLPLKQQRDQAKELYGKAFSEAKQTQASYAKLQRNIVRLSSRIKQARKVIRQQKKPLRILLTKATRQHKVKDIQQALVDLGYRVEKVDGLYGLETIAVIKKYQKANNLKVTGLINEKLIASIREKSGKDPLNAGHVYVRQGFRDVYDAPVGIAEPERALGTHFYSVLKFDKTDSQARWNVVTIKSRKQLAKVKSKPLATASVKTGQETSDAAKDALDRIVLPKKVSEFLSKRLTPGSSFIITDNGYSDETGKGTDFIVLAR